MVVVGFCRYVCCYVGCSICLRLLRLHVCYTRTLTAHRLRLDGSVTSSHGCGMLCSVGVYHTVLVRSHTRTRVLHTRTVGYTHVRLHTHTHTARLHHTVGYTVTLHTVTHVQLLVGSMVWVRFTFYARSGCLRGYAHVPVAHTFTRLHFGLVGLVTRSVGWLRFGLHILHFYTPVTVRSVLVTVTHVGLFTIVVVTFQFTLRWFGWLLYTRWITRSRVPVTRLVYGLRFPVTVCVYGLRWFGYGYVLPCVPGCLDSRHVLPFTFDSVTVTVDYRVQVALDFILVWVGLGCTRFTRLRLHTHTHGSHTHTHARFWIGCRLVTHTVCGFGYTVWTFVYVPAVPHILRTVYVYTVAVTHGSFCVTIGYVGCCGYVPHVYVTFPHVGTLPRFGCVWLGRFCLPAV